MCNIAEVRTRFPIALCGLAVLAGFAGCKMAANGKNLEGVRMHQQGNYQGAVHQFQEAIRNGDPVLHKPVSPDVLCAGIAQASGRFRNI